MNRIVQIALLFGLVWWSGAIAADGGDRVEYAFGAGDKIKVTVFGHDDLSGTFLVGGNDDVALPLIGKLPANGLTVTSLRPGSSKP
jgi:polysaccharide export outer membrane protein